MTVEVLVSADLGALGFARLAELGPGLRLHGAPHGIAIVDPAEAPRRTRDYPPERPDLDVAALLARAEVLVAARLPRDLPGRAPLLRWIHVTSAGIDGQWQPYLGEGRHLLTNASGMHAIPIAEFVIAGLLALVRDLPRLFAQKAAGRWEKFVVGELHGRTMLVLGTGSIGGAVAARASAFGMRVTGFRRREAPPPPGFAAMVGPQGLRAALAASDVVVSCLPSTPHTRNLLDAGALAALPARAILVNVGRADAVDGRALRAALAQGRIAGAVLDVFEAEPLPADDVLWALPNVVLSPHMSGISDVRDGRGLDILADNLARYLRGETLRNLVDPAAGY
jgi:phosphoglycerate dehydrogenase-like enzyme